MKAIISQPMKGKPEEQIRAERADAIKMLEKKGYEVVDTIFPDFENKGNVPLKFLAKSLEAIADADLVYFMPGWNDARGCKIEHECCVQYDVPFELADETTTSTAQEPKKEGEGNGDGNTPTVPPAVTGLAALSKEELLAYIGKRKLFEKSYKDLEPSAIIPLFLKAVQAKIVAAKLRTDIEAAATDEKELLELLDTLK